MNLDDHTRDQLRQRLLDAEFTEPEAPPAMTVFDAWQLYGAPTDWRTAIAHASLVFLEECPAYQALQARWSDAVDRIRGQGPPPDWDAIGRGEHPAWSEADDLCGQLAGLACEIGAVAAFALSVTWTGEIAALPGWLARALVQADIETYECQS